jgi:hypothetical protein
MQQDGYGKGRWYGNMYTWMSAMGKIKYSVKENVAVINVGIRKGRQ